MPALRVGWPGEIGLLVVVQGLRSRDHLRGRPGADLERVEQLVSRVVKGAAPSRLGEDGGQEMRAGAGILKGAGRAGQATREDFADPVPRCAAEHGSGELVVE